MTPTSKAIFLLKIAELYRIGNVADHETNPNDWAKPSMSSTVCGKLDAMLTDLASTEVITESERDNFYNDMVC